VVISQTLYDAYYRNTKFVPAIPDAGSVEDVPLPLKGFRAFRMAEDYEGLYRYLTGQAAVVAPELGEPVVKQPHVQPLQGKPKPASSQGEARKPKEQHKMSNTMKAAWLTGAFTLLAALITGLFILFGSSNNTTHGESSPIITGDGNQMTTDKPDPATTEDKK